MDKLILLILLPFFGFSQNVELFNDCEHQRCEFILKGQDKAFTIVVPRGGTKHLQLDTECWWEIKTALINSCGDRIRKVWKVPDSKQTIGKQKPNTDFRKTVDKRTVRIFTEKGRKFKVANIACIDPCKIIR